MPERHYTLDELEEIKARYASLEDPGSYQPLKWDLKYQVPRQELTKDFAEESADYIGDLSNRRQKVMMQMWKDLEPEMYMSYYIEDPTNRTLHMLEDLLRFSPEFFMELLGVTKSL